MAGNVFPHVAFIDCLLPLDMNIPCQNHRYVLVNDVKVNNITDKRPQMSCFTENHNDMRKFALAFIVYIFRLDVLHCGTFACLCCKKNFEKRSRHP